MVSDRQTFADSNPNPPRSRGGGAIQILIQKARNAPTRVYTGFSILYTGGLFLFSEFFRGAGRVLFSLFRFEARVCRLNGLFS